jgi:hypothetical protein
MSRKISYDQCYRLLQLPPGASLSEIKQRYRELARQSHPDAVPAAQRESATLQFQQINYAKETLEAYWEQHQCAPPSALQQRVNEAQWHPATTPPPYAEPARPTSSEQRRYQSSPPKPYEEEQQHWTAQHRGPVSTGSSLTALDRFFFVVTIEVVICVLLWLDYHVLLTLHHYITEFHTQTASAVFLKVYLSLGFLILLFCGYVGGICLILLALAFLIFRHEHVFAMLSARRKKTEDPFPHLTSPSASRRRW